MDKCELCKPKTTCRRWNEGRMERTARWGVSKRFMETEVKQPIEECPIRISNNNEDKD